MKINKVKKAKYVYFALLFVIVFLSVGYSAFNAIVTVGDISALVRAETNIRISTLEVESVTANAEATYTDYNVAQMLVGVKLPETSSSIKYKVVVTNLGGTEIGIFSLDNLPQDLTYSLEGYTLKDKICDDDNKCSLGITKEFYITISYKDTATVSDSIYDINLIFNFQPFYNITYTDVEMLSSVCRPTDIVTTGNMPKGEYSVGDEYICNVKDNVEYTFFVLSKDEMGINFIMERNVYYNSSTGVTGVADSSNVGLVDWYTGMSSNSYGPVTALQYLHNATSDWTNIPDININYTDGSDGGSYGYGKITTTNGITTITKKDGGTTASYTNLKSRLPYRSEVSVFDGTNLWMYNYLASSSSSNVTGDGLKNIDGIKAYWTISSSSSTTTYAYFVDFIGYVSHVIYSGGLGVRPVITLTEYTPYELGYQTEVIGNEVLTLDFGYNAPMKIIVKIDGIETDEYMYTDGVLKISNVSGNIEVIQSN